MVDKDFLKWLTDNIKLFGGQINVGGAIVATPDFKVGAKSQMILKAASNIVLFYKTVERVIIKNMIQWNPIINYFK